MESHGKRSARGGRFDDKNVRRRLVREFNEVNRNDEDRESRRRRGRNDDDRPAHVVDERIHYVHNADVGQEIAPLGPVPRMTGFRGLKPDLKYSDSVSYFTTFPLIGGEHAFRHRLLNAFSQGTGVEQRVGDVTGVFRIQVRGAFVSQSTTFEFSAEEPTVPRTCRVIVLLDKDARGESGEYPTAVPPPVPPPSLFLSVPVDEGTSATTAVVDLPRVEEMDRFEFLYDKRYNLSGAYDQTVFVVDTVQSAFDVTPGLVDPAVQKWPEITVIQNNAVRLPKRSDSFGFDLEFEEAIVARYRIGPHYAAPIGGALHLYFIYDVIPEVETDPSWQFFVETRTWFRDGC